MKPLLVVNPRSGGGRTGRVFDEMRGPIERTLGPIDVAFTERPRHASEIAARAAQEGRETVVAVGGDGSVHEVVAGLMDAREAGARATRLGIIGQGTGGDFRKTLGLEHRIDRYCEAIAAGHTRSIDVGRTRYVTNDGAEARGWFVNILSLGVSGLVDRYVASTSRRFGGTAAYLAASVRGFAECRSAALTVRSRLDGEWHVERFSTHLVAICNGRYFGSGMHAAPMARPDDGRFELLHLTATTKLGAAANLAKVFQGRHVGTSGVEHRQCDAVEIRVDDERAAAGFPLDVDGEPLGRTPLDVELVPGALEVFAPASGSL